MRDIIYSCLEFILEFFFSQTRIYFNIILKLFMENYDIIVFTINKYFLMSIENQDSHLFPSECFWEKYNQKICMGMLFVRECFFLNMSNMRNYNSKIMISGKLKRISLLNAPLR